MRRENFRRTWTGLKESKNGAFSSEFVGFMDDIEKPDSSTCRQGGK
jgi:hypothetical protein